MKSTKVQNPRRKHCGHTCTFYWPCSAMYARGYNTCVYGEVYGNIGRDCYGEVYGNIARAR